MIAALPVENETDLLALDTGDDLVEHCPQDAFACCRCRRGMMPRPLQVGTQLHEPVALLCGHRRLSLVRDDLQLILELSHGKESLVPTVLEL